jgi:spermidine synthase
VRRAFGKEGDVTLGLLNGRITHGSQFTDSERRNLPTTYYGRKTGVGRAIDFFESRSGAGVRVGAIGLGTGTLAAYARANDQFAFYEINPEVPRISRQYFTYLKDAEVRIAHGRGSLDIVMGDARLSLERDLKGIGGPRKFDVIVVDAFSGDAIPIHLLTRQAGDIYRQHLADGGVLAIHISNLHLDLSPVARGLGQYLGLKATEIYSTGDTQTGAYSAQWVLLTNNDQLLKSLAPDAEKEKTTPALLWTDDYSNLVHILK